MVTDEERREAARRLREAANYYESMERDVDFYPVENAIGLEAAGETTYTTESVRSLADLIEPRPTTTVEATIGEERMRRLVHDAAVEATGVDRDALLELAEEMERPMRDGGYSKRIARRIREACREVEHAES